MTTTTFAPTVLTHASIDRSRDASPGVAGAPRSILRAEGAVLLLLATLAYAHLAAAGWGFYAALFFVPDVAFLGYLAGARAGSIAYNATHSTLGPAILGLTGLAVASQPAMAVALVWAAHVGFDRMLGYGLKYGSAFGHTHLGRVGVPARPKAV